MKQKSLVSLKLPLLLPALFATGCGDTVFESVMFAPALTLEKNENPCKYFPSDQPCELVEFQEVFFDSWDRQTDLQGLLFKNPESEKLIIYSHGNGGHLYYRIRYALKLLNLSNVLLFSYRGYGKSYGEPSERNIYEDGAAAVRYAVDELGFQENQIYLFGRSMGTAVAINTAQHRDFSGLILMSPFVSGYQLAADKGLEHWPGLTNPFDSISKISNIHSPTLIIHGSRDTVISVEHGRRLHDAWPGDDKQYIEIDGATHWSVTRRDKETYWEALAAFIQSGKSQKETIP